MAKTDKRRKALAAKRLMRDQRAKNPGRNSNYSRKRAYLDRRGLWGFQIPEPKPWRQA